MGKGRMVRAAVGLGVEARSADMSRSRVHPAEMPACAAMADGHVAAAAAPSAASSPAGVTGSGNKKRSRKGQCHRNGSDKPPEHARLPRCTSAGRIMMQNAHHVSGEIVAALVSVAASVPPAGAERRSYSSSSAAGGSTCSERMLQANSTGRTAEAK